MRGCVFYKVYGSSEGLVHLTLGLFLVICEFVALFAGISIMLQKLATNLKTSTAAAKDWCTCV
jgi:hypothetical protein